MTIKETIISLELARKLKEKGLMQDSCMSWQIIKPTAIHTAFKDYGEEVNLKRSVHPEKRVGNHYWDHEWVSAFNATELGQHLPEGVIIYKTHDFWSVSDVDNTKIAEGDTIQEAIGRYLL